MYLTKIKATQLPTGTIIVTTDDLMQDFVSIITSFCARLYSMRRRTRKTECLIQCLKENQDEISSKTFDKTE